MKTILPVILLVIIAGCGKPKAAKTQSEDEGLQVYCTMAQTRFAVGQKLPAPGVKIQNSTDADVDLIGPTNTVIECMLAQPDKMIVPMCIAMPTGRDPRDMPTRKLKAKKTIELKADGIWYYNEQSGYEPYVFRQAGDYKFSCEYEELNSNIITITVSAVYPKPGDIIEFSADSHPARNPFKDFKVERKDLEEVLSTWCRVSQEHWQHGYSHVAFGDRTGTIKLKDGSAIKWMLRPGGLATLTFQDGTVLYIARELTPWENQTDLTWVSAVEKLKVAYIFLLRKIQDDSLTLVAAYDDKNLNLVGNIIRTNSLNLVIEAYNNLEQGPDLCHYSKTTRAMGAIIDVSTIDENKYYVSYYVGPEGGASKEIQIEKKNGQWTVVNDDGMWNVK